MCTYAGKKLDNWSSCKSFNNQGNFCMRRVKVSGHDRVSEKYLRVLVNTNCNITIYDFLLIYSLFLQLTKLNTFCFV